MKYFFSKKNKEPVQTKRLIFLLVVVMLISFLAILFILNNNKKDIEAGSTSLKSTSTSTIKNHSTFSSKVSTSSLYSENTASEIFEKSSISEVSKVPVSSQTSSQIKKQYVLDSEQVISLTKNNIKELGTKTAYSENISNPLVIELFINTNLSDEDISNQIYDLTLDYLDYNAYLEFQNNPFASQPTPFDYLYNIKYIGKSDDETQYIFKLSYRLNKQSFAIESFDSDEVVQNVLADVGLRKMDGLSQGKFSKNINIVKSFYSTSEAVESLVRYIQITVVGENNNANNNYTKFDIIYYGKNDTEYTFILFLA